MARAICFETVCDGEQHEATWRRLSDPLFFVVRAGCMMLELPTTRREYPKALVNGMEVIAGTQALRRGDLVRVVTSKTEEHTYVVGPLLPSPETAGGGMDAFTGLKLSPEQPAVRCVCGSVFAEEVAAQIELCPKCGGQLNDDLTEDERPGDEMI